MAQAATVTETDPFSIDTTTGPGAPSSGSMTLSSDVFTTAFSASSSMASFAPANSPYFIGVGGGGQASGNVVVTYSFTPVPIPAALSLLLSGVAGLGLFARTTSVKMRTQNRRVRIQS
jgi:hypothetical protein